MAISPELKQRLIKEFGRGKNDTGSPHVQIAVLTHGIQNLTQHLKTHNKDHSSRRGLLAMVSRRRRLLDYLKAKKPEDYVTIIGQLGIRK
ncbi:MAG: 30S ribosomal protein S15 [Fuerstiella sp.]|nr:30S ribosomal protein S15 [Fuerstiella sp.]